MKFKLRLLFVAFAVSFALVGALSFLSVIRFSRLSNRIGWVEHSYKVVNLINALDEEVREMDQAEFKFLVTGDSNSFKGYQAAALRMYQASGSLKALTKDNKAQQASIVLFKSDMALYLAASREAINAGTMHDSMHKTPHYQNSRLLIGAATKRLAQMSAEEDRILKKRTAERENYQQLTSSMLKALSGVFGIVTFVLFFLLLREFRRRLRYQAALQQKMEEIAQSKQELEHIAYATTHDLQEPLRKIRILIDRWQHQHKDTPDVDSRDTIDRVVAAVTRMQGLVSELMILTTLNDGDKLVSCPLYDYAESAAASLATQVTGKGAQISIGQLPVINGYPDQLKLLFKNLLENALKFTRPGIAPVISVTAHTAVHGELGQAAHTERQYHCIAVQDNGAGFDNKMADKMFGIFRQLHTEKDGNPGKGTGLAMCQRIMSNHKGRIIAHGFPGDGATFKLYFPADA